MSATRSSARPLACTVSMSALAAALAFAASPARAAGECGTDGVGADTLTCTAASYPNGITYAGSDGLNLVLNNSAMTVTKGTSTDGINLSGTTANDLTLTATSLTSVNGGIGTAVTVSNGGGGKAAIELDAGAFTATGAKTVYATHASGAGDSVITMTGGSATTTAGTPTVILDSEVAGSGTGNAAILMTGGTVNTAGNASNIGLNAVISNAASAANASITVTGGTVTGLGTGAEASSSGSGLAQVIVTGTTVGSTGTSGIEALNTGSGNATASLTNGSTSAGLNFTAAGLFTSTNTGAATASATNSTITARASSGAGIYALSSNGSATASMTGGSITTTGTSAGLRATVSGGTGSATAILNGGSISTAGSSAYGVSAQAVDGQAMVQMTGGTITTAALLANGLRAQSTNGLAVVQMTGGTITASANATQGVLATTGSATGTGTYNISITGGTVDAGGVGAVQGYAPMGGTITIGAGATINARTGTSGVAIATTGVSAGNAIVTTAGIITGQINFQAGTTNTLDITGGSIAGNINGGGNDALSFDLGSGSFSYDAAYTITGVTSVAMNSGTATLANTMTGNAVTVTGGALVLTGAINTPAFALNGGELSVSSDANLGTDAGALNFNGGVLQVTGTVMTSTARTITWGANGGGFDIADAGNVFAVSQTLSGGPLTKLGVGTLTLTSADTFSGNSMVNAGTLVLTADDTFSGVTVGNGTLVAEADETASNGVTINSGGTVQIGDGGTVGSVIGNVADNGALTFDRSDAVTYAGTITGTGTVAQMGSGSLTLTGTNTYSGGTLISAGTVTGAATSFGSGAIIDNAALVIDQPADAVFANPINGSGSFTKTGAGRLNYIGTGTLSGPTIVAAGLLSVNGSLASSAVTVASGATLGGDGTVGATTIQSGGAIAPGNSIGTLHVNGAFVQAAGSTYQVEVDPTSTNADLIAVNGTATIQSGAGLNVIQNPAGQYQVGTIYKVLTASGGVTGTYALSGQTTSASAFLGLKDSYDSNNVYLSVVQTRDPVTAATTPNQTAVAQTIDALPPTNPVATAVLNSTSDAAARSAFDQLSGQVQASGQGALLANGLYVRDVAFDRLRNVICTPGDARPDACDGKGLSIWAQGFGGWGGIAGNGNAAGLNHSMAGVLIGVDVPVSEWRLGVFGGYDHADFNLIGGGAVGDSNDYHLGVYGGTLLGDFALRLGASYSFDDIATDRAVAIGSFSDNLRGLYNGGTVQAFGELGYGVNLDSVSLEPFANLTYVSLRTGAFAEAGGPAALTVAANTTEDTIATLGVRPSTAISLGGLDGTLHGMVGWRRTFGQVTPDAQVAFAGGSSFSVTGASIARNAAAVEAGVDLAIMQDVTFGLTYGGQFSSRTTDQTGSGSIRVSF